MNSISFSVDFFTTFFFSSCTTRSDPRLFGAKLKQSSWEMPFYLCNTRWPIALSNAFSKFVGVRLPTFMSLATSSATVNFFLKIVDYYLFV
jgi:hypothetical protein